jgi:hypothetical protein
MIHVFMDGNEISSLSLVQPDEPADREVGDGFFNDYPAFCFELVEDELVLKSDADDLRDAAIATKAALILAAELVEAKAIKIAEIDAKTKADIVALVGTDVNQRNDLASYLAAVVAADEDSDDIADYATKWAAVATLRSQGNAKEVAANAAADIAALDAI